MVEAERGVCGSSSFLNIRVNQLPDGLLAVRLELREPVSEGLGGGAAGRENGFIQLVARPIVCRVLRLQVAKRDGLRGAGAGWAEGRVKPSAGPAGLRTRIGLRSDH